MLPRENHLFGGARPEPSQGSVPAGLALASDFSYCFQYKVGSSVVLRRPIEIAAPTVQVEFVQSHLRRDVQSTRYATRVNLDRTRQARPRESSDP
jgi:hypothetical protein